MQLLFTTPNKLTRVDLFTIPIFHSFPLPALLRQSVVSMKGLLEVRTDAHVWQSSTDMRFDLRCSTFIRSSVASTASAAAVANTSANIGGSGVKSPAKSAASSAASSGSASATNRGSSSGSGMGKIKSPDHQTSQRQQSEGIW